MRRSLKSTVIFAVSLIATTVAGAVLWEMLVHSNVYDCTDPGFIDYLSPGDWVHANAGQGVAVVHQVVHGRSMSEPDTIKQGWSVAGLWRLWYAFVSVSVFVSLVLALLPWVAKRRVAGTGPRR
jgi:hypothetical protein